MKDMQTAHPADPVLDHSRKPIAPVAPIAPDDPHKPMSVLISHTDALTAEYATVFSADVESAVRNQIIASADLLVAKMKSLGLVENTPFPVR